MLDQLRGDWLYGQVAVIERGRRLTRALRDRAAVVQDERGQTPTDYLMIVGLVAVVIVIAFVTSYWTTVKDVTQEWVGKVKDAILGASIAP